MAHGRGMPPQQWRGPMQHQPPPQMPPQGQSVLDFCLQRARRCGLFPKLPNAPLRSSPCMLRVWDSCGWCGRRVGCKGRCSGNDGIIVCCDKVLKSHHRSTPFEHRNAIAYHAQYEPHLATPLPNHSFIRCSGVGRVPDAGRETVLVQPDHEPDHMGPPARCVDTFGCSFTVLVL
jgi:hypothetical protein